MLVRTSMSKQWRIHSHDADRIRALECAARLPPVVARLLICRGLGDPQAARDFLEPSSLSLRDPELLPGATPPPSRSCAPSPPASGSSSTAITTSTA